MLPKSQKSFAILTVISIFLLLGLTGSYQAGQAAGGWVINEIHADPDGSIAGDANGDGVRDANADEFVELFNNTGAAADISGWTLSDGFGLRHTFPSGTVVPDQCTVVVFGGGSPTGLFGNSTVQTASTGALGLNNGGDSVTLNDGVADQASAAYGAEGGENQSLTLDPDITAAAYVKHTLATGSGGARFSPGTRIDGSFFSGCPALTEFELLVTEFVVTPTAGEFIEIYNPGSETVNLSDVYLTDATFFSGGTFYYKIVTGNGGGGGFSDFNARFPDGATIASGEFQTVAIAGSDGFFATYGFNPTYELFEDGASADGIPDMREATPGSVNNQGGLTNSGEVVILYTWDGLSDLVTDLDYALWGDKAEAVVKTGISIDGPDADSDPSTYLPDTSFFDQDVIAPGGHSFGNSFQRDDLAEGAEVKTGGNGANGHNETSEDLSKTWCEAAPNPNAGSDCPLGIALKIYEIQGSGAASPYAGLPVVTEGVVTADFEGSNELRGFFLQDPLGDGDPLTSDGIFVFDPGGVDVAVGDYIEIAATATEFFDLTELTNTLEINILSSGNALPAPAVVSLPVASVADWEAYEGMLVTIDQELTVTDNFTLGRFGEVTLSVNGRQQIPTNVTTPGAAANAFADLNARSRIQLDDGSSQQNPVPIPPYFAPDGTLRAGDTTPSLTGALSFSFGNYEIHPTSTVNFTRINERSGAPGDVGAADLKVASFNVLNYFSTIDNAGPICGPTGGLDCRGADTADEFVRQRTKIINAILAMDVDVLGIMEIENNATAAIQDLVNGLNAVAGAGTYAYIDTGTIGTDAIKVALIYKPASVSLFGNFSILDSSVDPTFNDDRNRPVLAQTFVENATGARFTVAVNHLKSKGSPCDDIGDPDTGDGQGNCNLTRTSAATAMANWLATDPTGSGDGDYLIIGDLNAYAMEDPINALKSAGYTDLVAAFEGSGAYTFVFFGEAGYLDHGLSSPNLTPQVTGTTIWHINADEPRALDYNNFNQDVLYTSEPFRASDHDPVIVGVDPAGPVCSAAYPSLDMLWPVNHKLVDVTIEGVFDPDSDPVTITIDSIFQDEPLNVDEDGNTEPDAEGVATSVARVRAERIGEGGNGRVYVITFTGTAGADSCSGVVTVSVPHERKAPAVNDGAIYDSTTVSSP